MRMLRISQNAGEHLERWADGLLAGELELWQLPRQVAEFYYLGSVDERTHLAKEIQRLEAEVNYWYYLVATPEAQRKSEVEQKLVARLDSAPMTWWEEIEQLLSGSEQEGLPSGPGGEG